MKGSCKHFCTKYGGGGGNVRRLFVCTRPAQGQGWQGIGESSFKKVGVLCVEIQAIFWGYPVTSVPVCMFVTKGNFWSLGLRVFIEIRVCVCT